MSEMLSSRVTIADRINAKLDEVGMTKAEFANLYGASRTAVSNYLNGKPNSMAARKIREFEGFCENWLDEHGEAAVYAAGADGTETSGTVTGEPIRKRDNFESADYIGITGLCSLCQETSDLGIVVGRSGYGTTYTLRNYAKLPKVIHIECNDILKYSNNRRQCCKCQEQKKQCTP